MDEKRYLFRGKDVTENVLEKIDEVYAVISRQLNVSLKDAEMLFNDSEIYKNVLESETGLWAQSAEYIADHYFEEIGIKS